MMQEVHNMLYLKDMLILSSTFIFVSSAYLSAKYLIITKCPQCGGLNEPANTTVILFSLFRHLEFSGGILHGYESIVGKTMRKISILIAIIAALATAIEQYTNAWVAVI